MENSLHFQIMVTHNSMNREIVKKAAKEGLMPGQPKILEYLLEHDGCLQKDMVSDCKLDKSTVTGIIQRMEEKHLIRREKDQLDSRCTSVYLTEDGKKDADKMEEIFDEVDACAWEGIEEEDKKVFMETLKKIRVNMLQKEQRKAGKK